MSKLRMTVVVESPDWADFSSSEAAANHLGDELENCTYVEDWTVEQVEWVELPA
jgi:hypothetical protein